MKKLFYSFFIMAMTAMSLVSCEDVPSPFDFPTKGDDTPAVVVDPAGSGTLADPYNVAAAIEFTSQLQPGEESSQDIYIKGKVVAIRENYSTQYGNATFTISDDGTASTTFTVYRALYLGNKKYTSGDLLVEGDEVIVCGKVTNYNGTLETQQNKAFLYSLNGVNEGGESSGGGESTGTPTGDGTLANPFNSVAAINYAKSLGSDVNSDKEIYVKGKIASVKEEFSTQYGNASFYISDDGSTTDQFYVFRTLYLGNKKWTSSDTQIKAGDEVIVCGKVVNYRGNTPETVQNESYLYSLNGKTADGGSSGGGGDSQGGTASGDGSLNNPFNAVAASNYASGLAADTPTSETFYIKGKVASVKEEFSTQYGNASFYISDDGSSENTFYVFRTLYLGNQKWVSGNAQIKAGDEVVICGKLVNYRGNTPETVQNESYIYTLNGSSSDAGGGDSGGGGSSDDGSAGSYSNPYSVSDAMAAGSGSGVYVKAYIVGYVSGQVISEGAHFTADGCDVRTNLLIAASASETNVEKCMPIQLPNGAVRTGLNLVDNPGNYGKEVLLYGNIERYFGVTGVKSVSYAEVNGNAVGSKP